MKGKGKEVHQITENAQNGGKENKKKQTKTTKTRGEKEETKEKKKRKRNHPPSLGSLSPSPSLSPREIRESSIILKGLITRKVLTRRP